MNDSHIVCAAARVIEEILPDNDVRGVTSVNDELFLLLDRREHQVCVYSINDCLQRRRLNVPQYKPDRYSDMTSCVRHKCLYMSDYGNSCILRYELASRAAISKWSVPGYPCGLSVTPSCNLLVTCQGEPNKLVELSADSGKRVQAVALQADIEHPWYSVQLTTGEIALCHRYSDSLHQVCVVGDDGKVTRSYGGRRGRDVGQLNGPYHLAVDKDSQFIFVADHSNARVVLLSPTLECVRCIGQGLRELNQLYFHQATRRLFVGQYIRGVTVIQM